MRVLIVNDYGFRNGGAESAILNLRQGLESRGDEVRIFSSSAGLDDRGRTGFADELARGTTSSLRTLLQTANPWAPLALKKELDRFAPEVVHIHLFLTQLSPLILPVLRDVPCVYTAHWQRAICPTGTRFLPSGEACRQPSGVACYTSGCLPFRDWVPLMAQMSLLRRWRNSIDRVVACSEALRNRLVEGGFPDVEVIPDGVPAQRARPSLADPPSVLFAGRLVREKGVLILLQAFRQVLDRVPSARLDIAGSGPEADLARSMAAEKGLSDRVVFHGWLSHNDLEHLYSRAWVQAAPSVWDEPFGMVAIEAAARGVPAVVSDVGGLAEIVIEEETGFKVPPGEPDALARALLRFVGDKALAETMGARARLRAAGHFSIERHVDRIRDLYQRVSTNARLGRIAHKGRSGTASHNGDRY
jgi:glycosyltransferase involved in cell wall biosynthesis